MPSAVSIPELGKREQNADKLYGGISINTSSLLLVLFFSELAILPCSLHLNVGDLYMAIATSQARRTTLWVATFLLASCSLVYELLIAQIISVFAGNTVVWYSLTIGIFLLGMGVGAFLVSPLLKHVEARIALFWNELVLCLLGALAPFALHLAALRLLWQTAPTEWVVSGTGFFLPAIGFVLAIGLCTGIELPLLMQRAREWSIEDKPISSTQLLAADYFGSLAGALAFSLLLWPNFEPTQVGLMVGALNLFIAIIVAASPRASSGRRLRAVSVGGLTAMLIALVMTNDLFLNFFLRRYYAIPPGSTSFTQMLSPNRQLPVVTRVRSPYQSIDLVKSVQHDRSFYIFDLFSNKFDRQPNFPERHLMFLNGEVQFFGDFEEVYHEFFAHVPVSAFNLVPKNVLLLGGGDGLLLRELLKYPELESVTLVDLDSKMLSFAQTNPVMKFINDRSFEDQRVKLITGDGYHFVRTTNERFDAVFMDFPEVTDYNLSRLYSVEFYRFVLRCLAENGFAAMNAGDIEYLSVPDENGVEQVTAKNRWATSYRTLRAAGFQMVRSFYSRLEYEYPKAIERIIKQNLTELPAEASQIQKESAAKLFMRYNTASLRSGFLMFSRNKRPLAAQFESTATPLFILNESRYNLALKSPLLSPPQARAEKVNSVFQPTWTGKPVWSIRRPLVVYGRTFSQQ